ncbi:hypothetical protein MKX03_024904 [Papaver bracteatum]|nr:hypothetical protein MKX03_024904 [Papaver bracteatum]
MVSNNSKSIVLEGLNNTEISSVNDTLNENVVVVDNNGTGLGNGTTQDTGYSLDKPREPEAALAPMQVNGLDGNSSVGSGQISDSRFTEGNVGDPEVSVLSIPPAVLPTLSLNSMTLPNSSVGSGQRSDSGFTLGNVGAPEVSVLSIPPAVSPTLSLNSMTLPRDSEKKLSTSEDKQATPMPSAYENENSLQSSTSSVTSDINLTKIHQANIKKGWAPRTSLSKMYSLLLQSQVSSHSVKPQWPSKCDDELVYAKTQIKNSPILKEDKDLYPRVYRNFSRFKRCYEMMERTLKVYIYKEGENPIFHEKTEPILKGIYASEG